MSQKQTYFSTNTKDLPDTGLFDVQRMAPEIREMAINPGFAFTLTGGVALLALSINRLRRYAAISVTHASEPVYVKFGPTTGHAVGAGIMLVAPGGSIVFGLNTDLPYTGEVSVIATNASTIAVMEG